VALATIPRHFISCQLSSKSSLYPDRLIFLFPLLFPLPFWSSGNFVIQDHIDDAV